MRLRQDPTGKAGYHIGNVFNVLLDVYLNAHQDIFTGFSKLFAGEFIDGTTGGPRSQELFYFQYCYKW